MHVWMFNHLKPRSCPEHLVSLGSFFPRLVTLVAPSHPGTPSPCLKKKIPNSFLWHFGQSITSKSEPGLVWLRIFWTRWSSLNNAVSVLLTAAVWYIYNFRERSLIPLNKGPFSEQALCKFCIIQAYCSQWALAFMEDLWLLIFSTNHVL